MNVGGVCKSDLAPSQGKIQSISTQHKQAAFVSLLRDCCISKDLQAGKNIHAHISTSNLSGDCTLRTWLVHMYLKCASLENAIEIFNPLLQEGGANLVTYTSMIAAYARTGHIDSALYLFWRMQLEGVQPDRVALVTVFQACASTDYLKHGRNIHAYAPWESDSVVASCIITMYGRCRSTTDAYSTFQGMKIVCEVAWNSIMGAFLENGYELHVLELYVRMLQSGYRPNRATFVTVLGASEDVRFGKLVHMNAREDGYDRDVFVQSSLVSMYGRCGNFSGVVRVFERFPCPDVVLWSAVVSACVACGKVCEAFNIFCRMHLEGIKPNKVTMISMLSACEELGDGTRIHSFMVETGYERDLIAVNALVSMYGRCGGLEQAYVVFSGALHKTVVTYNAMMGAFGKHGESSSARRLSYYMLQEGICPDNVTFMEAFCACSCPSGLPDGRYFHRLLSKNCHSLDMFISNALLNMYAKCGELKKVREVFDELRELDTRSWNALVLAHVECGDPDGLQVFRNMLLNGFKPDRVTFAIVLNTCKSPKDLRDLHSLITQTGNSNSVVDNTLIVMYGKHGLVDEAWDVFESLQERDVSAWNVLITACSQNGLSKRVLSEMQQDGVHPNKSSFLCLMNVCSSRDDAKFMRRYLEECGGLIYSHNVLKVAVLNMYSRCRLVMEAEEAFQKLENPLCSSWNSMMSALVQSGMEAKALEMFWRMHQAGVAGDKNTAVCVMKACTDPDWIERYVFESEIEDGILVGNAFISMYGKCRREVKARGVFERMSTRDTVSWNTMMSVLQGKDVVGLFWNMLLEGECRPDKVTFRTVLGVCSSSPALFREGRRVHSWIKHEPELNLDKVIANAMLNMYVKAGSREDVKQLFSEMEVRDESSWNLSMGAYGSYCGGRYAFEILHEMLLEGVPPDGVTFTVILSICSHRGMLGEAFKWFRWMVGDYYVEAIATHYGCIVDLLGRLGRVSEAEEVAESMPMEPDSIIWTTLLGACKVHKEGERGKHAADKVVELNPEVTTAYVVLSTIYREDKVDHFVRSSCDEGKVTHLSKP